MKKQLILIFVSIVFLASTHAINAQEKKEVARLEKPKIYKASPDDVKSVDAIIKATYDVISGDAGVKRNWNRFYSLFYSGARLIPSGKNQQTGVIAARVMEPKGYIESSASFLETNGFHEKEIARHTEMFGNIAHVFSVYEGKFKQNGETRTIRGINSFQLLNDGKRWWVMTIYWQAETPDNPIPEKYLKSRD